MSEIMCLPEARIYIQPVIGSGSKAQLILFSDGRHYVVKFKGNIQGPKVLPNELVSARLAERLGISVAEGAVVRVNQEFIDFEPELYKHPFIGGLQFGSLFYEGAYGNPPPRLLTRIADPELFAAIIVFDNWINNWDRKYHGDNLLYLAGEQPRLLTIDHGYAFGGPQWTVEELQLGALPLMPLFGSFYKSLGEYLLPGAFEDILDKVEALAESELWAMVRDIPLEWGIYQAEREAMIDFLLSRRAVLRETIYKLAREKLRMP